MPTAPNVRGYKRPWLRFFNCTPSNNALQLTSGGFMRASRASLMRRLQLSAVFCGPLAE